jgi:hypothetical protein
MLNQNKNHGRRCNKIQILSLFEEELLVFWKELSSFEENIVISQTIA